MSVINIVRPTMLNLDKAKTVMLWGPSGIGKTTQLELIARWIWFTYKKISRVIACDPGQLEAFEELKTKGVVQTLDLSASPYVLADSRRLSEGYWPRGARGEKFDSSDQCMTTPQEFAQIGAYLIDGATGMGAKMKNHMSKQPTGVGFKNSIEYMEDGVFFGGLQQGHYGLAQTEIHGLHVNGFSNLPVNYLVWTALDGVGKEKVKAVMAQDSAAYTVYAPQIVGEAVNAEVPSWFRDCIHMDYILTPKPDDPNVLVRSRVAWFRDHLDKGTGIKYLTKSRVTLDLLLEFSRCYPRGYIDLPPNRTGGVYKYLSTIEELKQARAQAK